MNHVHSRGQGRSRGLPSVVLSLAWIGLFTLPVPGEPPPASEPTYDDACAAWSPVLYACTVLAARDSRAKFVTPFRGGVHTVYVSEVLGHCPLLPGHGDLMAFIPEGIQAFLAAGEPPDYRTAPRPDLRQHLLDGSLPIVVTRWEDPAQAFFCEEIDFVTLVGGGLEVSRGDENAVAFQRLTITNPGRSDIVVPIRLCLNASNNGQPRGVSAPEYRGVLLPRGSSAVNGEGQLRAHWRAPPGATVECLLRGAAPRVLEWTPGGEQGVERTARKEPPFNRYYKTAGAERHDASKAFDGLPMSYWEPQKTPGEAGDAAVGLEFPAPRRLRQVSIRFEGDRFPRSDAFRLEVRSGGEWTPVAHKLNGKSAEELKGHPEIQGTLGAVWTLSFDPVEARAMRLVISAMPEGKGSPAIADVQLSYSLGSGQETNDSHWFDTASDYTSNQVLFRLPVAARSSAALEVAIPFVPASSEEAAWIERQSFEDGLQRARAHWTSAIGAGARLEVPEKVVQDVWNANVPHIFTTAELDPTNGLAISKTNVGWYEAIWPSLSAPPIHALDLRGLHGDAERYLEPFLRWQGNMDPPGQPVSREGFLAAADEYTWVRWLSGHGWILWTLAEHYLLSGDREWLDRALPGILAACDWIERERKTNKKDGPDGKRPPHWGLLPPGPTGDGAPTAYGFFGEACAWRGVDATAALLRDIEHPRAAELTALAAEYRECILGAMRESVRLQKPFELRSGRRVPFVPMDLYNTWKINSGSGPFHRHPWYLDVGPLHTVDQGVVGAESDLAKWMLEIASDSWLKNHLAIDEPWYAPQAAVHLGRDDIEAFLWVYYSLLAEGMDRQVFACVEGHGGVQNLPWGDGEHTRLLRNMLVQEDGEALTLARAVPRAWLREGKVISLRGMPTRFGKVGLQIRSNVRDGKISATIDPPVRHSAPLSLRLRHPQGKPIAGVSVNGRQHTAFGGEWIHLSQGTDRLEILATFAP